MARRATEAEKTKMRELRTQGMSYRAIAREVGYGTTTISCVCDPEYQVAAKARRQTPEYKAYQRTYRKVYLKSPEGKALIKTYQKAYAQTPERKASMKSYDQSPRGKAIKTAYRETPKAKAATEAYAQTPERKAHKKSYRQTIQGRLRSNLRTRLYSAINGNQKTGSAVCDLGCTIDELKAYLEVLFRPGMTWDNWAFDGWHIDHIKPLVSFDLTDREQFLQACHYTNLQPLWAKENLSKSDKTPVEYRQYQLATA